MAEQLQQVVQAAFQAAQAAASAAKTMEETMSKRSGNNKFGEASKVIRMPDCFGTENDHVWVSRLGYTMLRRSMRRSSHMLKTM